MEFWFETSLGPVLSLLNITYRTVGCDCFGGQRTFRKVSEPISCISDVYIVIHYSSEVTVMK